MSKPHSDPALTDTRAPREQKPRVDAIDYAKGIGIFLVVIAHVWRGLANAHIALPQPAFDAMDRWVYGFHMPLFFAVSGLFLYRSAGKPAGSYLIDKCSTILWPYLVWSVIYWALSSVTSGDHRLGTREFLVALGTKPIGHLWFLWILFWIAVVILALRKLKVPAWGVFAISLALRYFAVMPAYAWHLKLAAALHLPIDGPLFQFAMFFPYVAGAAAIAGPLLSALQRWPIWVWMVLTVAGAVVVTYVTRTGVADAQMFNPISGIAGTIMVLGIARVLEHDRVESIRFVGQRSLEIYLVHIIAAAAIRTVLLKYAHLSQWWIHLPAGFIAGVLVPLGLWKACGLIRVPLLFRLPASKRAI